MRSSFPFATLLCFVLVGACASSSGGDAPANSANTENVPDGDEGSDLDGASGKDASASDGSKRDAAPGDGAAKDGAPKDGAAKDGASTCTALQADCDLNGSCETDLFTDEDHCGACGSECPFLSACIAGGCQAPLDGQLLPSDGRFVVADGQSAYWLASKPLSDGGFTWMVRTMAHSSASASTLYESPGLRPREISLSESGTDLYVALYSTAGATVHRLSKAGGALTLVAQDNEGLLGGNVEPGVGAGGGYVFWIARDGIHRFGASSGSELWAKTFCAKDLLVENGEVYWSCYQGYVAHRSATAPATTNTSFTSYSGGQTFAVDGANIYTFGSGGIESQPLAGGAKSVRAPGAAGENLVSDGTTLYWSTFTGGSKESILEGSLAGGTPRALWNANAQVTAIVPGGQWLYFATNAVVLHRAPR